MAHSGYVLDGIDPELLKAATHQPVVDYADPPAVRATLRSALKISRALRSAATSHVKVTDRLISARPGSPEIAVRLYESAWRETLAPGLVFFHGGGFTAGDLDTEDARCTAYAERTGVVVLAAEYRLAPEHAFPAAFDDCYGSLEWLSANAAELGVDPARIAVGGSSAGGALAAAVALAARDRRGPEIVFQLLLYPVFDDRMATRSMKECVATPGWNQPNSVHMWRHYLGPLYGSDAPPYAAPARASDLTGLPPAHVMTADRDPLRDEGIAYAIRLIAADVPTELHNFPGTFHGFDTAAPTAELSRRALAEQITALAQATHTEAVPQENVRSPNSEAWS